MNFIEAMKVVSETVFVTNEGISNERRCGYYKIVENELRYDVKPFDDFLFETIHGCEQFSDTIWFICDKWGNRITDSLEEWERMQGQENENRLLKFENEKQDIYDHIGIIKGQISDLESKYKELKMELEEKEDAPEAEQDSCESVNQYAHFPTNEEWVNNLGNDIIEKLEAWHNNKKHLNLLEASLSPLGELERCEKESKLHPISPEDIQEIKENLFEVYQKIVEREQSEKDSESLKAKYNEDEELETALYTFMELRSHSFSTKENIYAQHYIKLNDSMDGLLIEDASFKRYKAFRISPYFFMPEHAEKAIEDIGKDRLIHMFKTLQRAK